LLRESVLEKELALLVLDAFDGGACDGEVGVVTGVTWAEEIVSIRLRADTRGISIIIIIIIIVVVVVVAACPLPTASIVSIVDCSRHIFINVS